MVTVILAVTALVAASTLQRTYTVAKLNERAKQHQMSIYAAEAAAEKVYARVLSDYLGGGMAAVSNNVNANVYQTAIPTTAENAYWANFEFWNGNGVTNAAYINLQTLNVWQVLDGLYAGLSGWQTTYRVVANARSLNGMYSVPAGVQQEIAMATIPAFQFAIFYNNQLEFTGCAPMSINGRTHANGPICLGPANGNTLTFGGTVTTTSSLVYSNMGAYPGSGWGTTTYNGTPPNTIAVPTLQLPIGGTNTAAAVREIINLPTASDGASLSAERFFNKAGVVMLVSNTSISVYVKVQGATNLSSPAVFLTNSLGSQPAGLATNLPFLSLTNRFYDYRERKWVMPTQIDVGLYKEWSRTNSSVTSTFNMTTYYPTIMYVADFRTVTNMHAVRLTNGVVIPTNGTSQATARGFTLATRNPLYVWGNYNCPSSSALGTANTSYTFPASLVADALTVLSPNWSDSTYGANSGTYSNFANRDAANTTINAAVIAGSVYTTGSGYGQWSGGVHNLPRLLEDWGGRTVTLNTSLVNLYNSVVATNQFLEPVSSSHALYPYRYYTAPTRQYYFNTNYLLEARLPPGTPTVSVMSRASWRAIPINTVNYTGP